MSSAPSDYVWWLAGRSAGIVALLLITASVLLGLAMAARVVPQRMRRGAMSVHRQLALIGLAAIAAHGLLLAADPWLKAGLTGVAVPFAIHYRPLWTSMGIIGGYLAAVLGLSFYVRRRIGARLWRRMHRLTVLVYVLALGHALGAGTDASLAPVRYAMLASALPVVFLFALRAHRARTPPRPASTGSRAPRGAPRPVATDARTGRDVERALSRAPQIPASAASGAQQPTHLQAQPSQAV